MPNIDLTKKEFYSMKVDEFTKRDYVQDIFTQEQKSYLNVRTHQLFCENAFNPNTDLTSLIIEHGCHAAGTKILTAKYMGNNIFAPHMYKAVDSLVVGDMVMNGRGGASMVTDLITGYEEMCLVNVTGQYPLQFTCNLSHKLTYIDTAAGIKYDNKISDITSTAGLSFIRSPQSQVYKTEFINRAVELGFLQSDMFNSLGQMLSFDLSCLVSKEFIKSGLDEIMAYARICGIHAYLSGGKALVLSSNTPVQSNIPFTIIRRQVGKYYGISLAGYNNQPTDDVEDQYRYILPGGIITHNTGTGKTLAAVNIIMSFIKTYTKMYAAKELKSTLFGFEKDAELARETPYILILGFEGTQDAFFKEFITYPEFGFINVAEREEYVHLLNINSRPTATLDDQRRLNERQKKYRKRLTDKSSGGFMDFKGFQELVNAIFDVSKSVTDDLLKQFPGMTSTGFRFDDIDKIATKTGLPQSEVFTRLIEARVLVPRQDNIEKYRNSLIVADELHNTYSSMGKNSRGVVLQYLLDNVPGVRFLGMSATLLNSSPAEFVDVLNYVLREKIKRSDYFTDDDKFLRPSVPDELGQLSAGYFSFLQDTDPKYYPRVIKKGDTLRMPDGEELPYIKFNEVPMSKDLQHAHEMLIELSGIDDRGHIRVPIGSEMLFDMTLPVPSGSKTIGGRDETEGDSDYKPAVSTEMLTRGLINADIAFTEKWGINVSRETNGIRLKGTIFEKENFIRWSPKYVAMLHAINNSPGKTVIFHKKVRGSGVLLIEEFLRTNGYIGDGTDPSHDTQCALCNKTMSTHGDSTEVKPEKSKGGDVGTSTYGGTPDNHEFRPARYLMAYGENTDEIPSILTKFNSASNTDGGNYKIIIGSKVIRESIDFKAIRHMMMVTCPNNVSMLMQIYGRAVRTNSHILLDPDQRDVTIHTFVSTINPAFPSTVKVSSEVQRYKSRLDAYRLIQLVDKSRHEYAIDANINRGTIFPSWRNKDEFPTVEKPDLGALYYEPHEKLQSGLSLEDLRTDTFKAHRYFKNEINTLIFIIKRLFIMKRIWTYTSLWKAIKNPPFITEVNPKLFDETLFNIALARIVNAPNLSSNTDRVNSVASIINKLSDPLERRIVLDDGQYKIVYIEGSKKNENVDISAVPGYYIMVPCSANGEPIIDSYIFCQKPQHEKKHIVPLDKFINASHMKKRYIALRDSIAHKFAGKTDLEDFAEFLMSYPQYIQEYFIQDCIMYIWAKTNKSRQGDPRMALSKQFITAMDLILAGLNELGALVTIEEVKTYRITDKYYPNGLLGDDDMYIGYESTNSIKLYNGTDFIDVSKAVMNRHEISRENDIIIGYLEDIGGDMKFKIRKSNADVSNNFTSTDPSDSKSITRGVVCSTRTKEQLSAIVKALGIRTSKSRVKNYCNLIFNELLIREIEAHAKWSKIKYCYYWWHKVPKAGSDTV